MGNTGKINVDRAVIDDFDAQAERWWSRRGDMRGLHDINPVRVNYVRRRTVLAGRRVLDVGCGGGVLAEPLAQAGARVTGIDMSAAQLAAAGRHAQLSGLCIDYRCTTAETLAESMPDAFDAVTCMELLEHVPRPAAVVTACARLVKPGGDVFFATLNRTVTARVLAVLAAEYLLGIVARGTHDWRRFVRPAELVGWAEAAGLACCDISGLRYLPFVGYCRLTRDTAINYLGHFKKVSSPRIKAPFELETRNP